MSVWKVSAPFSKPIAEAALEAHSERFDWDADIAVSASELDEQKPDDWIFEAWLPRKPNASDKRVLASLFVGGAPKWHIEKLPDTDWVTESQKGVEPIRAGRFLVRTPDHPPEAGTVDFVIPASQAFGTGQHETTAGCTAMLDLMKHKGVVARNFADIGTGTGLLAFAGMHLWPAARATASDIDPICAQVVEDNAALNRIEYGAGPNELTMVVADGMDDELLQLRGPYDLLIANILAGPLIDLAPDFARAMTPGGSLVLAGLLETQEPAVRRAYRQAGLRLAKRHVRGDWSILWLRKRRFG